MAVMLLISALLLAGQDLPKFMGREVTVVEPGLIDEFFPKGPASICIEGPPERQCYTAPKDFGKDPKVALVQVEKNMPALLFSAESGGVSGWAVHFALLHPGMGKDLEELFSGISVSNQNQHAFWTDLSISEAQIFLTAEYVWGSDEGHYGEHRYIISAYVMKRSSIVGHPTYDLEDQYMTVRRYDLDANADVLASEKQEILARLARVKAETERPKQKPR
jgi:hypothetical protein